MKKIVLIVLVFTVCLSLAGVAMAVVPKPPASICLDTGAAVVFSLVVKPSSAIKMLDGTQKFWSIQGALLSPGVDFPVIGSGYIEGNVFHFTLNGTYNITGTANWIQAEGFWDVIAHTGTMYIYITASGNWTFPLSQVPCTDYDILFLGSGAEGSPLLPPK
jgi:hypothetical protein